MKTHTITSVFNDGYIAEVYDAFRKDPASVDESWRQFFQFAERLGGGSSGIDADKLQIVAHAASLLNSIRAYGHSSVAVDPLGTVPPGAPELTLEYHGLTEDDLRSLPGSALGTADNTVLEAVTRLRGLYCSTIGFEFEHIGTGAEREWFRESIDSGKYHKPLSNEERIEILKRLTQVDTFERFLGRVYQGYKRFSIEGSDALIPMLDECIAESSRAGARDLGIAMAHRGRINVLTHTMGQPYASIFNEFEGKQPAEPDVDSTGDVKYHLGYVNHREIDGNTISLTLVPNPSHLEFVNPVLGGVVRAKQRTEDGGMSETAVVPVCIHGDAAFSGEGIVPETLNLSLLKGFRNGGTIHIIVNNQIGFTTDPSDSRSTRYSSDLAKGFDIPVLRVNGDNPEACIQAIRLAVAYRFKFKKDILIDLVSYRRHGHNETDEPMFTQPELYTKIKSHKTPREVWAGKLASEGVLSSSEAEKLVTDFVALLEVDLAGPRDGSEGKKKGKANGLPAPSPQSDSAAHNTAVAAEKLIDYNDQLLKWPEGLNVNSRLARTLARRKDAMGDAGGIDWGHAESLAFASMLADGVSIRLTGQDVERGTFSHRQAVLHNSQSGEVYIPHKQLVVNGNPLKARFDVYNSPLSEMAVLAYEYGYSVEARDTLVLWEAQYGDFANVAQPIVDQFISSDRAKWSQDSGVVMLLPHGYEGGGPEHSSARLERYLQLCAENNMRVAYPTTPAQYFHILRRQAAVDPRRPLVLMQPKSMLRLPEAASRLGDLTDSKFQPVLDDPTMNAKSKAKVRRLVFCTGKIYYDLLAQRTEDVALIRVEELYPWPKKELEKVVAAYSAVEEYVWAQEEPKNMGSWFYVSHLLAELVGKDATLNYIGRPNRASPSEGYVADHNREQSRIISEVFTLSGTAAGTGSAAKRTKTGVK